MAKPKLYLDTSVPSAYLDSRWPDRQVLTQEFWRQRLSAFEPVVSVVVLEEIRNTPNLALKANMQELSSALLCFLWTSTPRTWLPNTLKQASFHRNTAWMHNTRPSRPSTGLNTSPVGISSIS
jgi:hypothetical protein